MKKIFVLIILLSINCISLYSNKTEKGHFFIRNFSPQDYKGHAQIWDIVQDHRGILYFCNGDGIVEYDGNNWRLIVLPNKTNVRSLAIDDKGRVFVGSTGEIGYLEQDAQGKTKYVSLVPLIQEKDLLFQDIFNISFAGNCVYFRAFDKLFCYDGDTIKAWSPKGQFSGDIVHEMDFYVLDKGYGLYSLENENLIFYDDLKEMNDSEFRHIAPSADHTYLIFTKYSGVFTYDFQKKKQSETGYSGIYPSEVHRFILDYDCYRGIHINSDLLYISSQKNGFVETDEKGTINYLFNESSGLQNNAVFSIILDKDSNLWVGTNNGISYVEISSPIRFWGEEDGLEGMVQAITRYKGTLYIATYQGFYYIQNNTIHKIPGNYGLCWSLLKFNCPDGTQKLIGGTVGEVFEIEKNSIKKIKTLPKSIAAYKLTQSKLNPKRLYISLSNGITTMLYKNNMWIDEGRISGVYDDVRSVQEDQLGNLWLSTFRHGYIRIKISGDINNPREIERYKEDKGLSSLKNVHVYPFRDRLVYCTEKGLMYYDETKNYFFKDTTFWELLHDGSHDIFDFQEGPNHTIWICGLNQKAGNVGYGQIQDGKKSAWIEKPFNRIPEMMMLDIYVEDDSTAWLGGTEGLYHYTPNNKDFNKGFEALIRKVKIGNDSILFYGKQHLYPADSIHSNANNNIVQIDFKNNDITFEFTSNNYEGIYEQSFQYILKGYDEKVSTWTTKKFKEYTNLPEGEYTFQVRAINVYNTQSEWDSFTFHITPPYYRTLVAYVVYVILVILFIRLLVTYYTRRLKATNITLEKLVKARTAEIESQKEEIQAQAEKLAVTNKELEKLSIVASETNNAIMIMDEKGNIEWVNEGFTRLYGFTLSELRKNIGSNIAQGSGYDKIIEMIISCVESKQPVIYESMNTSKSGRKIWAQTTMTPILNEEGEVIKLITIDSDINKLKEAERLIEEQRNEIEVQRDIAVQQRDEIAIQKDEIIDSLVYARRIQNAIIPSNEHIQKILRQYFIFYLPRDIVSGDFYWIEKIDHKIIIAVADCTGHGVPGAFMSMLGVAFLNEIILKNKIIEPHKILNHLRKNVIDSLHQTGEEHEARDGMDISICTLDLDQNVIWFAGANNPLYLLRDNKFIEIEADKMPVGIYSGISKSFTLRKESIQTGDTIYMFTDGFADQFGGKKGKKLKYYNFKKKILENCNLGMNEQRNALEQYFKRWKGQYEQVDDILLMGIKI